MQNIMTRMKRAKWLLMALVALSLTACGGSSGGGSSCTDDGIRPQVTLSSPASGTTDVAEDIEVTITFSEKMDADTLVASNFYVRDALGNNVAGTISYKSSTFTAKFVADNAYTKSETYTAAVTTGITDCSGDALIAGYSWTFTIEREPDTTGPVVTDANHDANSTGVSVTTAVTAVFDEAIDPDTLTTTTFTLVDEEGNSVNGTVSYNEGAKTAVFNYLQNYESLFVNTTYTARLTTGITDLDGNPMAADYTWSFKTTTTVQPPAPE